MSDPPVLVTEEAPKWVYTDNQAMTVRDPSDPTGATRRKIYDFDILLKGPATFIRFVCSATCRVFFQLPADEETDWHEFFEGAAAGARVIVTRENWSKMQVVGPTGTTVNIYASRIPGSR